MISHWFIYNDNHGMRMLSTQATYANCVVLDVYNTIKPVAF
jgi:hypothetical protein